MSRRSWLGVLGLVALMALSWIAPAQGRAAGITVHINKVDEGFNALARRHDHAVSRRPAGGRRSPEGRRGHGRDRYVHHRRERPVRHHERAGGRLLGVGNRHPLRYDAAADSQLKVKKKNREVTIQNIKQGSSSRVNDPTGDTAVGDGTNISQFGPSVALWKNNVFIGFNDSTGFDQSTGSPG